MPILVLGCVRENQQEIRDLPYKPGVSCWYVPYQTNSVGGMPADTSNINEHPLQMPQMDPNGGFRPSNIETASPSGNQKQQIMDFYGSDNQNPWNGDIISQQTW